MLITTGGSPLSVSLAHPVPAPALISPTPLYRRSLTAVEADRLLGNLKGNRFELFFHLCIETGAPPAAILAMQWHDLDESKLSPRGLDALARHTVEQARDRLFFGHKYIERGLLFADYNGGPVGPGYVLEHYVRPHLLRAGLPADLDLAPGPQHMGF